MRLTFPFDAVLFDLDGVLVDTTELHYRVWEKFACEHGRVPSRAALLATNGRPAGVTIRQWLGAGLDDQAMAALTAELETYLNRLLATEPIAAVAGAREYLAALDAASVPKAVATGYPKVIPAATVGSLPGRVVASVPVFSSSRTKTAGSPFPRLRKPRRGPMVALWECDPAVALRT
jgi:beta-phosphoglucomutase-like phosphatase (HAD superfamily)